MAKQTKLASMAKKDKRAKITKIAGRAKKLTWPKRQEGPD